LISDTDGNIFGGFTPVKWESREWNGKYGEENDCYKGDDSLRSFLFTLRNPHDVPPRKFALKAEKKQYAIFCNSAYCASFGYDIRVENNCNINNSYIRIGTQWSDCTYANDTAFEYFLTGAKNFTVKEIEVFQIADEITLPADVKKCANGRLFQERASEICRRGSSRAALGDTGGRQRVGEGDEHSRRLFVADEFARQAGECRMCSREEDERLVEVEGDEWGSPKKRQT
jgi:hypothetical protein